MSLASTALLYGIGIMTGTVGAMLGIGGGVFLIPFLVLVVGLPMHQAIATSIIAVIATSSAGAALNLERGTVNIRLGMTLEIATVAGAILGGVTANYLSGSVLTKIFASLLLVVAVLMIRNLRQGNNKQSYRTDGRFRAEFPDTASGTTVTYSVHRMPGALAVSVLAGNISGLLGVGGGIFKVPAMHLISGVPIKAATATSNFMIGVTAAASAFIYFAHGHLNPQIAASASLGVLTGSMFGVYINRRIHPTHLNWIFAGVLFLIAVRMFFR
ncbi:MAG: sulfite exporter TauE/SafE family protein [Bacteroidota bacterium]